MSITQAQAAVEHSDNYWLCVVPVGHTVPTEEDVRANVRFVADIGESLATVCSEFQGIQEKIKTAKLDDVNIAVELADEQPRFPVDEGIWTTGMNFPTAVEPLLIKTRPLAPDSVASRP